MTNNYCKRAIAAAALLTAGSLAHADVPELREVNLGGLTQVDQWTNLTSSNHSGYGSNPGTGDWPGPIYSNDGGTAELNKVSNGTGGGPFLASSSIYFGGLSGNQNVNGGTLGVSADAISGLSTVMLQVNIGEASGYDFWNNDLPTLTLYDAGGSTIEAGVNLVSDYSSIITQEENGTSPVGDEVVYVNLWGIQWDLSEYENVASLSIEFTAVQHAQVYGLQLNQSDMSYGESMIPVPEPSTWALLAGAGVMTLTILFRRRKAARSAA